MPTPDNLQRQIELLAAYMEMKRKAGLWPEFMWTGGEGRGKREEVRGKK
jgi:hypothetical protein